MNNVSCRRDMTEIQLKTVLNTIQSINQPNINQPAPNLVKMYVTTRCQMSSIMDLIGTELPELFSLEFAKIAESDFVYTLASTNVDQ